ncbi:MAG: hypothetical protein E7167_03830 [Firmicutes bacterium]|nr:hypothetical protein [Bacillota bacterium]
MEEMKFKSLNELYNRLFPAFNTKKGELQTKGIIVKEIDLWNYLKENVWAKNTNLSIYDMVSDIMKLDDLKIKEYLKKN